MNFEDGTAVLWDEELIIPTYPAGEPDHNPMFLEKRAYQSFTGLRQYPLLPTSLS